ncbi:MAG: hypothetical protein R2825_22020 [Saprospiraceae bacterium]
MKILLIEVNNHTEVLRSFLHAYLNQDVVALVAKNGKELIEFDQNKIHSPKNNQSIPDFLSDNVRIIEEADLIIIVAIEKWFRYFSNQSWLKKSVLVVFNGNFWFNYYQNIVFTEFKDVARFFKSFFKMDYYFRKKILKRIEFVTFQNNTIAEYMMGLNSGKEFKLFPCIPYDLPNISSLSKMQKNEINIVIPGAITSRTKNYYSIYLAFKAIVHLLNKSVKLFFLGHTKGGYAYTILNKFQSIGNERFNIEFFSNRISNMEYDNILVILIW